MENTPGRGEHFAVGTLPALNQVAQEHGGHHGGGHPPLVEAGGDVQVSRGGGVGADIGDAVQAHAVLGGPVEFLGGMGVWCLPWLPVACRRSREPQRITIA